MSRRPLGASLPPELRLVAYEDRIRELVAAIDRLEDALVDVDTLGSRAAYQALRTAIVALQELKARPIGRRPGPRRRTETVAAS
jgi:hypothetical protein